MRRAGRTWTQEDMAIARHLYTRMQSYKRVADVMGRSPNTIREQLQGLRGAHVRTSVDLFAVPAEVLADRDHRRDLQPKDYTAAFFGDPLPGYSAWDRRGC